MAVVTTNFAVVKLPVKDLEVSVRWYQDVMGIPFTFDFKPGDNEAWLNVGGVGLGLIRCPDVPKLDFSGMDGHIHPIIQLQVQDIHSVYEEIKSKGIEVSQMYYFAKWRVQLRTSRAGWTPVQLMGRMAIGYIKHD